MSNLFTSSIGRKLVMSVSGLFLVLFLLFHMSMNLAAIFSEEAYNGICEFLGANWYAMAGTMVLAAGFLFHIIYAFILTIRNLNARGHERYAERSVIKGVSWASKNMLILGGIVLGFLLLHFYNFWYKMQFAELIGVQTGEFGPAEGYQFIEALFAQPVYVILYLVWLCALWMHLTHGFWSAFQTIGWDNQIWIKRLKCISSIFATVVVLGFALVVVVFFLRSLCGCCGGGCIL